MMLLGGLRMAKGEARAKAEVHRMITEKVAALAEGQFVATAAALKGGKKRRIAKKAGRLRQAGSSQQAQAIEVNTPSQSRPEPRCHT